MNDDDVTSDASSDQNGGVGGGGLYHVTPHDTSSVLSDLDSSSNFNSVFEVNSDDFSAGANSEFNFERNPDDDVSSSSRSHRKQPLKRRRRMTTMTAPTSCHNTSKGECLCALCVEAFIR